MLENVEETDRKYNYLYEEYRKIMGEAIEKEDSRRNSPINESKL